jgi:hypothetical protein
MTNDIALPKDYKPFPKLIICGNTLINVQIPFEIDGETPLLIGDNGAPKIWLSAPASPPAKMWHQIVRTNRSLHEAVKVIGAGTQEISVTVSNRTILNLSKRPDGISEVTELDLRPIGLNIFGNINKLMVGTNQLVNNTFQNVRIMVGIGEKRKNPPNNSIQK